MFDFEIFPRGQMGKILVKKIKLNVLISCLHSEGSKKLSGDSGGLFAD